MSAPVQLGRSPSWRVVLLPHDPAVDPAASWERLAVWCAIRALPAVTPATRVQWADHDPSATGAARLVGVGCAVGPGVTGDAAVPVIDTPSVWCASVSAPGGPRDLADDWRNPAAALTGLRHWWLGDQVYWPVRRTAPQT